MRTFRITFERFHQGYAEIEAATFDEAAQRARDLEAFEIQWNLIAEAHIEVVDVDELLPDDDD